MKIWKKKENRISQAGNVLFLILIAVVLFGALSFAISKTMTGGSPSDISTEKNRINSAYLHQFPTEMRKTILRMKVRHSIPAESISFAHPGTADYGIFGTTPENELFHPQGGDIPYQHPPAEINGGSEWIFNGNLEVDGIGKTGATANSSDLLAILTGIRQDICEQINHGLSGTIETPPSLTISGETDKFTGTFGYTGTISDPAINGKDAYCYFSTTLNQYVYFYVLDQR